MKYARWFVYALAVVVLALHQDFWNWSKIEPRLFGVLPVGVWYHALFCIAASVVMALLVAFAWPKHLEDAQPEPGRKIENDPHGH